MDAAALAALFLLAAGVILAALGTRRRSPPRSPPPPPAPPAVDAPVLPGCPCERGEKGILELLAGQEGADSLWQCTRCRTPYHFSATDGTARPLTAEELARDLARLMGRMKN